MTFLKNLSLVWLAAVVFSTAALAQTPGVDPNDPVLKTLRDAEASELLPLKDYCLEKYPQLASSLESQLAVRLQTMYGPNYPAKVKKFVASRDFKESRPGTLTVFKAWPEKLQLERCQNLPPAMVFEAAFVDVYRQGLEENLATLTEYVRACNTLYPGEKYSQIRLDEQIEHVYGEGTQAQRKYAAFLNTPKIKAMLADRLEVFEQQRSDKGYRLLSQCFSPDRRACGVLLPTKVPAPAPDKPTSTPATQALAVAQNGATTCLDFASNGTGPGNSKYIAHNSANLSRLANITRIEGVVRGKTGYEFEKPVSLTLNTASIWRDSGYVGRGPTGGWKTWASSADAEPTNLIDIRFGAADGIYPGKTSVPAGTQSLFLVQRNTQDGHALKTFDSFALSICGTPN